MIPKLVLRVAVSTADRQASRLAVFLQSEDRPVFKCLKSDSTARNHVCLGRPTGRLQSGDRFPIAAETVRWWSWMGELRHSFEPNKFIHPAFNRISSL